MREGEQSLLLLCLVGVLPYVDATGGAPINRYETAFESSSRMATTSMLTNLLSLFSSL